MKKTSTQDFVKKQKRAYQKPEIKEFGSIKDHTKAVTAATGMDGGVAPSNRVMTCVSLPPFIQEHHWLLEDQYTQEKFRAAIFAKVKPGDVVLDLGTGTGLHAFFAAQAGAKKVYAVDSESVISLAKTVAQQNQYADQIEFIQAPSEKLELPEKVDVIITNIGFFNTLKYFPQVIKNHLKPQGKIIPEKITLDFSLLQDDDFYGKNIRSWEQQKFAMNFSAFKDCALTRPFYGGWQPEQLIAQTALLGEICFSQNDQFEVSFKGSMLAQKSGTAHGIIGWYTFCLAEGIEFSTKPPLQLSPMIWNQWFLPFSHPIKVVQGQQVPVNVQMNTSPQFPEPIWQWSAGELKSKSNFETMVFSKEKMSKEETAARY